MNHQLLNDPVDCEWLRDTHLRNLTPADFKSFEICGNEDAPDWVRTYPMAFPTVFDTPLETFALDKGDKLVKGPIILGC